jgi:hypothetical protein
MPAIMPAVLPTILNFPNLPWPIEIILSMP